MSSLPGIHPRCTVEPAEECVVEPAVERVVEYAAEHAVGCTEEDEAPTTESAGGVMVKRFSLHQTLLHSDIAIVNCRH